MLFEVYQVDTDPNENLQYWLNYFRKLLRVSNEIPFERWGKFDGMGVQLVGKDLGDPSEVRIFSHSTGEMSFVVTEFFDVASKQHVQPGYDLIERTFTIRSHESEFSKPIPSPAAN